jgi:hypothetical protein
VRDSIQIYLPGARGKSQMSLKKCALVDLRA